jgi:hypothetical protein
MRIESSPIKQASQPSPGPKPMQCAIVGEGGFGELTSFWSRFRKVLALIDFKGPSCTYDAAGENGCSKH